MRLLFSAVATVSILFLASTAHAAVTYTATATSSSGNPLNALLPGDLVTIDVTLRSDGETTYGVAASATGYDTNVLAFQSGIAASRLLNSVCFPASGCFGGLDNFAGPSLFETTSNVPGLPEVQMINATGLPGTTNTGVLDEGVGSGVAGDAQVQLVFAMVGAGTSTIQLGADTAYGDALVLDGGVHGVSNNTSLTLTVIPEAGTALLIGLGLAGLAAAKRRS